MGNALLFFSVSLFVWHAGSQFSNHGSNPCLLHCQCRVLTTGPPGKSVPRQCILISGLVPFAHQVNLTPSAYKHLQSKRCSVFLLSLVHLKIPVYLLSSSFYR